MYTQTLKLEELKSLQKKTKNKQTNKQKNKTKQNKKRRFALGSLEYDCLFEHP